MTTTVAVIGTSGRLVKSFADKTAAAFSMVGHNTGNLAFQYATWHAFTDPKCAVSFDFDPDQVRERARLVCLPAANFLYTGFDLGGLAARLEATNLPLMVLGLGAQAFRAIDEVTLKPGTLRLLRLMAERCKLIMVRGPHTAAVLERHGVNNFEILGCPSNFVNPNPHLGEEILSRWRAHQEMLAYAPTFYSYNAEFERKIYETNASRIVDIVVQDPLSAVALARGERSVQLATWLGQSGGFLSSLPKDDRQRAFAKLRVFFDAEAWMEAYRHVDGVLGSRIHGVNLAWQAGRAALVVSYDLRTQELAETMGIPMLKSQGLDEKRIMEMFDDRVRECAQQYDIKRASLARKFATLLEAHQVAPSHELLKLGIREGTLSLEGVQTDPSLPSLCSGPKRATWGFLEQYNRSRISGWVAASDNEPPGILIRLNGRQIDRVVPTTTRPDLGPNAWSFDAKVPASALTRDVMPVEAIIEETGKHLGNSPVVQSFAADDDRKVLRGREGWLFLQNDTNAVLDQIRGRRLLSTSEIDDWVRFLRRLDDVAASHRCTALYLVAPNKECVYAEYLSDVQLSPERPVFQLMQLADTLALKNVRFVYPLEALRRRAELVGYPKGDSHWTDFGALIALRELIAAGEGAFGQVPSPPVAEDFSTHWAHADLLSKLGGSCVEPQPLLKRRPNVQRTSSNGVINTGRVLEYRSETAESTGTLLFVHDSFGDWLLPHLAARFARTIAVWGTALDAELLQTKRPTAILFERAERFLIVPPR